MKIPLSAIALSCLLPALGSSAVAAEIQVQAPVVNVEPIPGPSRQIEECPPKPANGLAATLSWDLGLSCTSRTLASDRIDAYRVFYRWDDRVHSQIMDSNPGSSVALTLKLN